MGYACFSAGKIKCNLSYYVVLNRDRLDVDDTKSLKPNIKQNIKFITYEFSVYLICMVMFVCVCVLIRLLGYSDVPKSTILKENNKITQ